MVRLYDLPKGAEIKENCFDATGKKIGDTIIFDHLDGMYSYCLVKGTNEIIHLSGSTPLKKVGKKYKIIFPKNDKST